MRAGQALRGATVHRPSAFTRTELLIVVLVCCALGGILLASGFFRSRRTVSHLTCAMNLRQIGMAGKEFKESHDGLYPWELTTNNEGSLEFASSGGQAFRHFQCQSNFIVAQVVLVCPQDTRQAATNWATMSNTNVSYFVGLDSDPKRPLSIMAGDRNITRASGVVLQCNPSAPPQWVSGMGLHGDRGHVVFSDCHVEELDSTGLSNALQRAGMSTNRFEVP